MFRRKKGSAIAEFGPALFVFLILLFFPLMDILALTAVYCCGWYCNFLTTREAAVRRQADGPTAANEITTAFYNTGLAKFVGVPSVTDINHTLTYSSTDNPPTVRCTTTILGKPFLTLPQLPSVPNIPGLTGDITFTMQSIRPREVTN